MPATQVYLITGANRGIGYHLVKELLSRHHTIFIYAAVRNPASASALVDLQSQHPNAVEIVKFISGDVEGNLAIAKLIQERFGYVDVVIPCAAVANYIGSALATPAEVMTEHFTVNVTGVMVLFQATHDLLKASKWTPKFIPFTSGTGSLTSYIDIPMGYTAYGSSKAALNYLARKIHFENEWLVCFPLSPGIVETDMAKEQRVLETSGNLAGLQDQYQISPEVAGRLLVDIIENATRERYGGEFVNIDGTKLAW